MANTSRQSSDFNTRPVTSASQRSLNGSVRVARFAEATSVDSPIEAPKGPSPFGDPSPHRNITKNPFSDSAESMSISHVKPQPQVSDVGFGYLHQDDAAAKRESGVPIPNTPRSPLKSALKSPGAPPRQLKENPLSPTWKEEEVLEKAEGGTDKQQAQDLKVKTRVRMAKLFLRGTNFSCSLIVLAMIATTFNVFNATKALPPRNGFPSWSKSSTPWPQIVVLVVACISLAMSVIIFWAYFRGGHRKAEKLAVYYTVFAVGFFIFSIVMWAIAAAVLQQSHANSNAQDVWGWSCKDSQRKTLFQDEVNYELVCRLQNWSLVCCIIEVVVEIITIIIYGIVFYRYYSKRLLRKSMANRDKARSDLYLAHLRSQTAPNTPGLASPMNIRDGGYNPAFSPRWAPGQSREAEGGDNTMNDSEDPNVQYVSSNQAPAPKPFTLSKPPSKEKTPRARQGSFETQSSFAGSMDPRIDNPPMSPVYQNEAPHQPAAPGEQQYASVPIPGAYASPLASPAAPPEPLSLRLPTSTNNQPPGHAR